MDVSKEEELMKLLSAYEPISVSFDLRCSESDPPESQATIPDRAYTAPVGRSIMILGAFADVLHSRC